VALLGGRDSAEESVDDDTGAQQVLDRPEGCFAVDLGLVGAAGDIRPLGGDERSTSVGQNQNQVETTVTMSPVKDLQASTVEGMPLAHDGDRPRKVFGMGSLSYGPSGA
jgi:hypothetical protein